MDHVRNVGGGPGDEVPRRPPRRPVDPKCKEIKKLTAKKRKYKYVDKARAATVAEATERAERGGAMSGVVIEDQLSPAQRADIQEVERFQDSPAGTLMMGGRGVAIDESQPQKEPQQ